MVTSARKNKIKDEEAKVKQREDEAGDGDYAEIKQNQSRSEYKTELWSIPVTRQVKTRLDWRVQGSGFLVEEVYPDSKTDRVFSGCLPAGLLRAAAQRKTKRKNLKKQCCKKGSVSKAHRLPSYLFFLSFIEFGCAV